MNDTKSAISQAQSYTELGEFWDTHDLADFWKQTAPAEFEVDIQSEVTFYAVEHTLSERIETIARQRGISPETLLNLWVQEKVREETA